MRSAPLSVLLAVAWGCSRPAVVPDADPADATPEQSATTRVLRGFMTDGLAAAVRLEAHCDDRRAYLDLRRDAAASLSAWRVRVPMAAEATYGPRVALLEAGGSIGALDRAVQRADCAAVGEAVDGIAGAFRVSDLSMAQLDIPPGAFGQALSDAAYQLGQGILESTAYVPDADDAALADVLGFLDFLDQGIRALGIDVGFDGAALDGLRSATTLSDVTDRATLVRATGLLGASIRRAVGDRGFPTTWPYRPLHDGAFMSALMLPLPAAPADPARAALGRALFFDRRLSRGNVRACATCHVPDLAYADGRVAPLSLDPARPLRRNTPSLLYAPLAALLTWDGRVRTADRQALQVIHTGAEMGLDDAELTRRVALDPAQAAAFREAFHEDVTPKDIGLALSAFEASALLPGRAPIDRFATGEDAALSPDMRAGLDVFAGKGRCARCHVPPVFGGSRPPDFTAPVFAVLGVPTAPGATSVDADRGRDGAFRTPTVRDVSRTAPYFHHGRYATLEQVVDFYDRGGGRGVGLDVPNLDPEVRPLHLSAEDKRVLLVFLRDALDDGRDPASNQFLGRAQTPNL